MTDTAVADFFNDADEPEKGRGGVPRDGRGRALLVPKGLEGKGVRVPYSSASGLADSISDDSFLHEWEMCYLAIAMGRNPDLARLAAAETYHTGLEPLDPKEKRASKWRVKQIIERALDRQKIHEKADYGTAVHGHTEPGAPAPADETVAADVDSFWAACRQHCITIVDTERFTANDTTMSAGTFDHGVRVLGHPLLRGYIVSDKKTGRFDPFHWEVQMASYAHSELYDTETDARSAFPEDLNLDFGLVFHIKALTGVTELVVVDLQRGWRNAQIAAQARDAQDEGAKVEPYRPATFEQRLWAATAAEELRALWRSTDNVDEQNAVAERARTL